MVVKGDEIVSVVSTSLPTLAAVSALFCMARAR